MTDNAKSPILSKNVSSSIGLEPPLRFPGFEGNYVSKKLGDIIIENLTPTPKPDKDYVRIGLYCHAKGIFHEVVPIDKALDVDTMYVVQQDNLIVNITFAWEHAIAITTDRDAGKLVSHRFPTYAFRNGHCHNYYKFAILKKRFRYNLGVASPGGAGRNRVLNKKLFLEIPMIIPLYDEQQKIADFLSLVDERIEKQRQLVEVLKRYKRGALLKIFDGCETWTKYLAKDVGKISTGSSNTQDSVPDGTYPFFIRSVNVSKSNKFVYDGEAVLTIGDGQIGKVFHYINGKFDCHQRVYMITKFTNISGRYFYHFFSTFFYNRAMKMSARNTVDSVRMEMIADMPIYVPDRQAEVRIVNFLDGIDSQIQQQEHVLEYLNIYKNGLLQQMFV